MLPDTGEHTCTYVHTYIHTYIRTYIHTYVHTYIHTYMHMCIHAYTGKCFPCSDNTTTAATTRSHRYHIGERYLSTPLFDDIPEDMTAEEMTMSKSTPLYRFGNQFFDSGSCYVVYT